METPEMPEAMKKDIKRLIESFKAKLHDAAEEALNRLYTDYAMYIEGDTAENYRSKLRSCLEYKVWNSNPTSNEEVWAHSIRAKIFKEHREELEKGIIADLIKERDKYKEYWENDRRHSF